MRKGEINVGKVWEGKLVGTDLRIGIVVARFNQFITSQLLSGALGALERHGVDPDAIDVAWVPGAYEIPLVAETLARKDEYDAVITLGTVIRGATTHRSEEHTSELQSRGHLVCRLLLEKKKKKK